MKTIIIVSIFLACALPLKARQNLTDDHIDSLIANHKIIPIDGNPSYTQGHNDSVYSLIQNFYYSQFHHAQDPDAPYFLFMSKDAKLAMGIGGCVRMRGYYDWDGAIPASGFAPYLIETTPDPTHDRHFNTTPAGTSLFFRVIGRNKTLGNYQLYIEANFNGYQSRDFHLKKAYAVINDFTIGYANSTFSDPAAVPSTIDAQGPNNKILPTRVLVRWMPTFKNKLALAVSIETPSQQIGIDGINTTIIDNWLPDFAVFAQYQWSRSEHVRLSGIVRTLGYRDLILGNNHNVTGWGVQISSVAHPVMHQLTTYFSASYGHGYASLGGDLLIGSYDLIGMPDSPGRMYAPRSYGWNIGVQYNFTHAIFTTLTMSQTHYLPKGGESAVGSEEYRSGQFWAANVFWNMTPRIQVGAELDLGRRKNFNGTSRWARRIGVMAQFSF